MNPSARDAFLQRVRQAAATGNRPGAVPALQARGTTGYQGAGVNPVQRFCEELTAVGGHAHVVADSEAARVQVVNLVRARSARKILLGRGPVIDGLDLVSRLSGPGAEITVVDALDPETSRVPFFAADLGITGVAYLVAETGTVVLASRPDEPRSPSLLPPVHIAVAERSQLLPDLYDLFDVFSPVQARHASRNAEVLPLPSCLALITGPSKTGDIELRLVTGVHGPGELHVVLIGS